MRDAVILFFQSHLGEAQILSAMLFWLFCPPPPLSFVTFSFRKLQFA